MEILLVTYFYHNVERIKNIYLSTVRLNQNNAWNMEGIMCALTELS